MWGQIKAYDGLIHDKNGKTYDPTDGHMIEQIDDSTDIGLQNPLSTSYDDRYFETAYQADEARHEKELASKVNARGNLIANHINKFDGLIHAQNKVIDPSDGHVVSLEDELTVQLEDHPISDARDDKMFEEMYQDQIHSVDDTTNVVL